MAGAVSSPRAATPAPGQSPGPQAAQPSPRPQQAQVKLTLAQLTQLTQGAQVRERRPSEGSRIVLLWGKPVWKNVPTSRRDLNVLFSVQFRSVQCF